MADKKKNRYRNPANDLVDYAEGGIRNALLGIRNSAASSLRGSAAAARRTRDRLEREAANDRSLKAKVVRKNQPTPPKKIDAAKPKPKPRGMANIPPKEANAPVNVQARKPKPAPAASTTSKPKPKPAASAAAKPKPKPPANTTRSATVMRSPAGKEYAGPAFGERKAESKVGPIADGQKYSVQKTGKSVMQQQAAELRKMGTKSEGFKAEVEKARKESMAKSLKIKQEAEKKRRKGPRG